MHVAPHEHSTVGVPKRCGGFVAIWLRACEEFADNRFQLLFIYIDIYVSESAVALSM